MQQHQRQQPERLRLVGHQRAQQPREPDRLGAQLAAHQRVARGRGVALVEDQVQRRQHRAEPRRQVGVARDLVGDPGAADLGLGAHDALRHRALGDQEGARHLAGGQPAEQPQRQRDARLLSQRGVAAGEDQPQALVGDRAHGLVVLVGLVRPGQRLQPRELLSSRRRAPLGPQPVDRAVARRGDDPRRRVGGDAVARPALERDRARVLDRLLGAVEVAERAGERGDRLPRLAPEQAVQDLRGRGAQPVAASLGDSAPYAS